MKIVKNAVAGTLESSDVYVQVEPNEGIEIVLESVVLVQFGDAIKASVMEVLAENEVENVNDDPVNHPQFNYSANTKYIRRWRIPDAQMLLTNEEDDFEPTPEQVAELEAVIAKGQEVLNSTVVDQEKFKAVEDEINAVLAKYGMYSYPEEPSGFDIFLANTMEGTSKFLVDWIGGGSIVDWILSPARNVLGKIFK